MNLIAPYARIMPLPLWQDGFTLLQGRTLLQRIEWCARISHRSEEAMTADSYDRFLRSVVLQHGDWSVVEHASVSVDFYVDRGITHELVRHRLFAFTQESTRFVNYEKKTPPAFVEPEFGGQASLGVFHRVISQMESAYRELIQLGNPPQIARTIFPNALASRIIITGNLRNWRHFLLMRTTKEAHPQMRQVTIPLLAEFKEKIPILYEDIEPEAKQADNMRKGR
jgi:thymidylate synthase (FAD)